jgi:ABC-type transporter Mla MlaB component
MSGGAIRHLGDARFAVEGDLDFSTVGALLTQGLEAMAGHPRPRLDFSGVRRTDSAGLPASLVDIARISNVSALLPVHAASPA